MIVVPSPTDSRSQLLAYGKPSSADLCSCTDDAGEQKKKKKMMQVLRRLPRLRMSRNLAPIPVETVPLRTSVASHFANGQAIRDDEVRCSILGAMPSGLSLSLLSIASRRRRCCYCCCCYCCCCYYCYCRCCFCCCCCCCCCCRCHCHCRCRYHLSVANWLSLRFAEVRSIHIAE